MNLTEGTTWSNAEEAFAEILVFRPTKNTAGTTVYDCQAIYVDSFTNTLGPNYYYDIWTGLAEVPTFSSTRGLLNQLEDVQEFDCEIAYYASTSSYKEGYMTCDSPATVMNLANFKFTANSFSV